MPNEEHSRNMLVSSASSSCYEVDQDVLFPGVSSFVRWREQKPFVLSPEHYVFLGQRVHRKALALIEHGKRVKLLARLLALHLALDPGEINTIGCAAQWHDIGKVVIPETILKKAARLTRHEFEVIRQHSVWGAILLLQMHFPSEATTLVYHHHEHWDGHGYPDCLRAEDIPLGARIIALVDAFDAMTTSRPYQVTRTAAQAKDEIWRCAGTQFDRRLTDQFCTLLEMNTLMPIYMRSNDAVRYRTASEESGCMS